MREEPIKAFPLKNEAGTVGQQNYLAKNETGANTQKPPMGYTHGGFIKKFKDNHIHKIGRLNHGCHEPHCGT